jgi:predicted house-cleaning noncanonical NTP pyrophosphatase (MazG superfamily)
MKIFHNKLVRDSIPKIIEDDGKKCVYRKLERVELNNALVAKLSEEGSEFLDAVNLEELADILEVVHALIEVNNFSHEDVEKIRMMKQELRGAFFQGIFLEYVIE